MMQFSKIAPVLVAAIATLFSSQAGLASAAQPVRPFAGHIVLARATAQSTLFLWDATPYVIELVRDRLPGDGDLRALEATALQALAQRAAMVKAPSVSLRVLYQKTGAVNPAYGTPTFAGVELVFSMRADKKSLQRNARQWEAAVAQGTPPKGLSLQVVGKLPPQSP